MFLFAVSCRYWWWVAVFLWGEMTKNYYSVWSIKSSLFSQRSLMERGRSSAFSIRSWELPIKYHQIGLRDSISSSSTKRRRRSRWEWSCRRRRVPISSWENLDQNSCSLLIDVWHSVEVAGIELEICSTRQHRNPIAVFNVTECASDVQIIRTRQLEIDG